LGLPGFPCRRPGARESDKKREWWFAKRGKTCGILQQGPNRGKGVKKRLEKHGGVAFTATWLQKQKLEARRKKSHQARVCGGRYAR